MALNIFTGSATSNWGTSASWTLNRVPNSTDGDTAYFGPLSPTCSVNVLDTNIFGGGSSCYNFDCSTYTRQIVINNNLFIFGTYSNFGGGSIRFTSAASSGQGGVLGIIATCSVTSNGYVFKREAPGGQAGWIRLGYNSQTGTNGPTITLLDQLTTTNAVMASYTGNNNLYLNGATLSIIENLTTAATTILTGTSNIEMKNLTGGATISITTGISIGNNVFINCNGPVGISTITFRTNNNTFKWISGTLSIGNFNITPNNNSFTYDNSSNTLITNLAFLQGSNGINGTVSAVYPFNATTLTIAGGPGGGSVNSWWLYGGFSCSSFSFINSNANSRNNLYLSPSASYYINSSATIQVGAPYNAPTYTSIYSTTNGVKAPLIISYAATQSIFNIQFTDIDASGGSTILPYQYNATFSNVSNIQDLKAYYIMTNQIQFN